MISELTQLSSRFEKEPWFHSINEDTSGRIVVYAKYINRDVSALVPDKVEGKQVLLHFSSYQTAEPEKFTTVIKPFEKIPEPVSEAQFEDDAVDLNNDLWSLKRMCGKDVLTAIFHEVHDGELAITNYSIDFPDVKTKIAELYNEFGFDVLFDELGD